MDAIELLAREDEFKRLNKQLEKKTESLMKEIEHQMNKQDIFSEFQPCLSLNLPSNNKIKKHCCTPTTSNQTTPEKTIKNKPKSIQSSPNSSTKEVSEKSLVENEVKTNVICDFCAESKSMKTYNDNHNMEFLYAFVEVNIKDGTLPVSFSKDRVTIENVCKFLSSKIKLMSEQIERLQNTINKKDKERLYKEQRTEADKLTSELKRIRLKSCNLEVRCASQEQVIDSLKQQLEISKKSEREFRESTRALSSNHQSSISKLESQIKYLTTRLKKQNALIDNLRKQNLLLSIDDGIKLVEKQYSDLLNQDV